MTTGTKTRDEILELLRREEPTLRSRFKVKTIGLFGSFVRDEPDQDSDIDLLVEFYQPIGLFDFIRLKTQFEALLGRPVDLVTPDALHPALRDSILSEAVHAA